MILFGLDTGKAEDRKKLPEIIATASLAEITEQWKNANEKQIDILATGMLTRHEAVAIKMLELRREELDIQQALRQRRAELEQERKKAENAPAQADPAPGSWEALRVYAERLPSRGAGQYPHPVMALLKLRLGRTQFTPVARPPVQARAASTTAAFAEVTSGNFTELLAAAGRYSWRLSDADVTKLRAFIKSATEKTGRSGAEVLKAVDPCLRLKSDSEALWRQVRIAEGGDTPKNPEAAYKHAFEQAWEMILATVEHEVLTLIGMPNVCLCPPGAENGDNRPGSYNENTKTMTVAGANLTTSSIVHEFGHHIEEQGPTEIWLGLASILNWLSKERALLPAPSGWREPLYRVDDEYVGVPRLMYSATYYEDGATELLSTSMEHDVLTNINVYISDGWPAKYRETTSTRLANGGCGPEFTYLLLHALRPAQMREAGFPNPALLSA